MILFLCVCYNRPVHGHAEVIPNLCGTGRTVAVCPRERKGEFSSSSFRHACTGNEHEFIDRLPSRCYTFPGFLLPFQQGLFTQNKLLTFELLEGGKEQCHIGLKPTHRFEKSNHRSELTQKTDVKSKQYNHVLALLPNQTGD